jgi:hypothetical protein
LEIYERKMNERPEKCLKALVKASGLQVLLLPLHDFSSDWKCLPHPACCKTAPQKHGVARGSACFAEQEAVQGHSVAIGQRVNRAALAFLPVFCVCYTRCR